MAKVCFYYNGLLRCVTFCGKMSNPLPGRVKSCYLDVLGHFIKVATMFVHPQICNAMLGPLSLGVTHLFCCDLKKMILNCLKYNEVQTD
jgi:hypothetical protein